MPRIRSDFREPSSFCIQYYFLRISSLDNLYGNEVDVRELDFSYKKIINVNVTIERF